MQPIYNSGYMPMPSGPTYIPPPPPPQCQHQTGPTVIRINKNNTGTHCQFCGIDTNQTVRKTVGSVTIAWSFCLLFTTGFLCCIPCCMDTCKDS
jgi:hypothetical protein